MHKRKRSTKLETNDTHTHTRVKFVMCSLNFYRNHCLWNRCPFQLCLATVWTLSLPNFRARKIGLVLVDWASSIWDWLYPSHCRDFQSTHKFVCFSANTTLNRFSSNFESSKRLFNSMKSLNFHKLKSVGQHGRNNLMSSSEASTVPYNLILCR